MKKKHIHVIQIHSLSAHSQLWKWKIQFRISFSPLFVRNLCKPDEHYTQSFQLLLFLLFMTMIFWKIAINFTKNCQIINLFALTKLQYTLWKIQAKAYSHRKNISSNQLSSTFFSKCCFHEFLSKICEMIVIFANFQCNVQNLSLS